MSNTTITKPVGFSDETAQLSPRQERKVYNRAKYRMTKRLNLWTRSLARAKDPAKQTVLKAKIDAMTVALEILDAT